MEFSPEVEAKHRKAAKDREAKKAKQAAAQEKSDRERAEKAKLDELKLVEQTLTKVIVKLLAKATANYAEGYAPSAKEFKMPNKLRYNKALIDGSYKELREKLVKKLAPGWVLLINYYKNPCTYEVTNRYFLLEPKEEKDES